MAREEMHSRMVEREKARQDIVLEAKGDLSTEAEEALKKNLVTNALHHQLNQNVMEGEQQVMSAYEAAFRKIKEATGVGDVHEVIQKFVTQKDTEKNLMAMTREAQARIDQLADGGCLWSTNIAPSHPPHAYPNCGCWQNVRQPSSTSTR